MKTKPLALLAGGTLLSTLVLAGVPLAAADFCPVVNLPCLRDYSGAGCEVGVGVELVYQQPNPNVGVASCQAGGCLLLVATGDPSGNGICLIS